MNKETKKALTLIWNKRNQLNAEGSKLYAKDNKLYAEGNKLWAKGDKLHAEGYKLWAEGDKLHAEGYKLWAEGNKIWAEAVIQHCGNVVMDYTEEGCVVDGELFKNQES